MYFSRGHITLIQSQPVFALTHKCCVLTGEASYTNYIVWFDPIRAQIHDLPHSTITPPILDHYSTDAL